MKVILSDGTTIDVQAKGSSIEDILEKVEINPEEVIVAKNGKIVSEYEAVDDEDELKVVRIVHGG